METLEKALAAPADTDTWLKGVRAAASDLTMALRAHIDEVEGPRGLLAEIRLDAPRLCHLVDELTAEHPELLRSCERLRQSMDDEAPDFRQVRRRAMSLLGRLSLHRQTGSDLVYEAYHVDIGGEN